LDGIKPGWPDELVKKIAKTVPSPTRLS
jgi:hypothetical protein